MDVRARRLLMIGLVAAFLAQTWLVYTDPAGRAASPLSGLAAQGQAVWRDHNCQACHQIFGFGGFLGPDLTNAFPRLDQARLDTILTQGSGLMPAFGLAADERAALACYLEELDRTGVGVARAPVDTPPAALFTELLEGTATDDDPLSPLEQQGLAEMQERNCIDCHLPNVASAYRAADLTAVAGRLGHSGVTSALTEGVPGTAMPVMSLSAEQIDAIHATLLRLDRHGPSIRAAFERAAHAGELSLLGLPWFEYPRESHAEDESP